MKLSHEPQGAECGCRACGQVFAGLGMFDRHQNVDYSRRPAVECSLPASLGLVQTARGTWTTPEGLANRERLSTALAAARSAAVTRD